MLRYEAPAKAFCDKMHIDSRIYGGVYPFYKPRDVKTRRTLKLLTALSSICVRRRDEVIAAAVCYDSSNNPRPTLLLAGDARISAETRNFIGQVLSRLHDWSTGAQLSTMDGRNGALRELLSTICTFQARRWVQHLYDNDIDHAILNTRLGEVRSSLDRKGQSHAGLEALLTAFDNLRRCAQALLIDDELHLEEVDGVVNRLIILHHVLATKETLSVMQLADYSYTSADILDPSRLLVVDDIQDLECNDGHLLPDFSLNRYFANITAVVRYALHLLTFAANDYGSFASGGVNLDFCDSMYTLDDSGTVSDGSHAVMRILAAMLERSHEKDVTFISAVGSSAPLCPTCYRCYTTIYSVRGLPPSFPVKRPIACSAAHKFWYEHSLRDRA